MKEVDQIQILEKADEIRSRFRSENVDEEKVQESFMGKMHELLQAIFGDDTEAAYDLLEHGDLKRWRRNSWRRKLRAFFSEPKKFFYLAMLAATVSFLVSEAVGFYAVGGVITAKTYVKAVLTELSFIFLSGYVASDRVTKWAVRGLTASVFCLMIFVISAQTVRDGISGSTESAHIASQIETLEKQVSQKQKLIEYYIKKDWPRNASVTRLEKEKLVGKLLRLKDEQAAGKNKQLTDVERYKSYGKAFFRVVLLLINFLITRRIFKF